MTYWQLYLGRLMKTCGRRREPARMQAVLVPRLGRCFCQRSSRLTVVVAQEFDQLAQGCWCRKAVPGPLRSALRCLRPTPCQTWKLERHELFPSYWNCRHQYRNSSMSVRYPRPNLQSGGRKPNNTERK